MDGLILAINLGKFNSLCCWYDPATKVANIRSAQTNDPLVYSQERKALPSATGGLTSRVLGTRPLLPGRHS